jgi:hypothetical protein
MEHRAKCERGPAYAAGGPLLARLSARQRWHGMSVALAVQTGLVDAVASRFRALALKYDVRAL